MPLFDEINICFVIDDNYAEHCAVTIASILLNSESVFHFYILYNELSLGNKNRLYNLKKIKNFEITFVNVDLLDFEECYLHPNSHFTVATYFRLKISSLLPNIDKIIYLDSDIIVNRDLKELWSIAFEDAYIIACKTIAHESNCKRLGLPAGTPCINAGVMVLDLNKMREHGLENIFFECLKQNTDKLKYADQDVINLVLSNKKGAIKHIQQNWNTEDATGLSYDEDYLPILHNPYIIHFMTGEKPWRTGSRQLFKQKYWQYHHEAALVNPGKLIMTLLVRNEEDIVRYNIDFHLRKGVDFIIATDNGSTDGTLDILREYEKKGVLRLIEEPQHNHNQAGWNNRMAQMACDEYGADFIFHCDADEFWFPRSGCLKQEITSCPEDVLSVNVTNVLLTDRGGEESFPGDTRYAVVQPIITDNYVEETKSGNMFFYQYPPKVIFKTAKKVLGVSQGNHTVINKDASITEGTSQNIMIFHYPVRGKARFFQKVIRSGSAYENSNIHSENVGFHVKRWYASYKEGLLDEEYKKLLIHEENINKLMLDGFIENVYFNNIILGHEKKNNEWIYFNRKFEYEDMFQDFYCSWAGHKLFGYDLIRNIKPQTIVELGTHKGTSLFSFCQAVKDARYDASLFAVDTWCGDEHAGFYDENVFKEVNEIKEKYYGSLKINLLRKTFDEAVSEFGNNSIDLVHIDGFHTYEAVKHDFETWLPKVKKEGIVLLHDIFINRDDFGVYKFWEELKREYKTIEFHHSYGLGVLFKNNVLYQALIDREKEWQIRYSHIAEDKKNAEMGKYLYHSERSLAERVRQIASLDQAMNDRESRIILLTAEQHKITSSHSWKITMPLRLIGRLVRRDWSAIRASILSRKKYSKNSKLTNEDKLATMDDISCDAIGTISTENHLRTEPTSFSGKRILLVSYYCPSRAHAGGLRILDIYSLIKSTFPNVRIDLYTHKRPEIDWSYEDVAKIFDNIFLSPVEDLSLSGFNQLHTIESPYDVIDLQFHQAAYDIASWRKIGHKIIFTPMESLLSGLLIALRCRDLFPVQKLFRNIILAKEELMFARKADEVVCVSEKDALSLRMFCYAGKVCALETAVSNIEFADALDSRHENITPEQKQPVILYIAYFGSETNINALKWYLINVHPLISDALPEYKLQVVGRGDLSAFQEYQSRSIEFVGEVLQLTPYIRGAKVGIAPALNGGGFRGKINQYSLYGVPVVASCIAAKGLVYQDGLDIFIADQGPLFAKQCIRLLRENDLNREMGQRAREKVFTQYTWESKINAINNIYNLEGSLSLIKPKVTVLVPSFNHGGYLRKRIESIMAQTYSNFELIVIDDCSSDDSAAVITSLQKTHGFRSIMNKKNSGTPFAAWEYILQVTNGDYIWICESDDYADPNFLDCAVEAITNVPNAAIAYCDSWIVDEHDRQIDHTDAYFHDIWRESRWDKSFIRNGKEELNCFQLRGQAVPNMSSALISTAMFRKAFRPFMKKLKLTGDWLFVGLLMRYGDVVYFKKTLNYFRRHNDTARVRVQSARSQAEFILTKYILFLETKKPVSEFVSVMSSDAVRFLYEPAGFGEVAVAMMKTSLSRTLGAGIYLAASLLINRDYLKKFYNRRQVVKRRA